MREQINILKYGFLIFLIVTGIVSIFYQEENFIDRVNSMSIPIFLFSISIILVKWNKYGRTIVIEKINSNENIDKKEDKKLLMIVKEKNLVEYFENIDTLTKRFNFFAMLSFASCLLSIVGIFLINGNYVWVNIFSLAIVYFDFFVLDDWLRKFYSKK